MSELESQFESDMNSDYEVGKIHVIRVKNRDEVDVQVTVTVDDDSANKAKARIDVPAYTKKDGVTVGPSYSELLDLQKNSNNKVRISKKANVPKNGVRAEVYLKMEIDNSKISKNEAKVIFTPYEGFVPLITHRATYMLLPPVQQQTDDLIKFIEYLKYYYGRSRSNAGGGRV